VGSVELLPVTIVVDVNGEVFTFAATTGATLPMLPTGTFVEVRGERQNGTLALTRLRVEDNPGGGSGNSDRDGSGGRSGSGGGGDCRPVPASGALAPVLGESRVTARRSCP
jgi:uncharacterized membrane protein YgcG